MGTLQRKVRERQARQKGIQEAAMKVFSEKGFLRATIEDIASAAELSVGTIYLYYRGKEELYVSLLLESMDRFTSEILKIKRMRIRPDRKLRRVWDFFYDYQQRFPESYKILLFLQNQGLTASISPAVIAQINRRAGRNFSLVAKIVEETVRQGSYRRLEPRVVVDLLWSLFMGLVHLSETRQNLGLTISTLEGLHRKAFEWFEEGIRRKPSPVAPA